MRKYSLLDHIIFSVNATLQTATGQDATITRANPAENIPDTKLSAGEKRHAAALMRINHVGEVCAQALYQGQALTARSSEIQQDLQHAAREEIDHLSWCRERINELGGHTSYLNPAWYIGSLTIGVIAGLAGDKISLGFLAETERQVEQHLSSHLQKLPQNDRKSRSIIEQMRDDEIKHATFAEQAGATKLPTPVKFMMKCLSKVMTQTAYWI